MQDFQALIEAAQTPPEDLGKMLRPLLSSGAPLVFALGSVLAEARAFSLALAGEDLSTESGRFAAIKRQGMIEGMKLAVEKILAPVKELNNVEESTS